MIDLTLLRRETDSVRAMLARRGVSASQVDELVAADVRHRELLAAAEQAEGMKRRGLVLWPPKCVHCT